MAEEVADKRWANFCDYFGPRPDSFARRDGVQQDDPPPELAALFGGDVEENGSGSDGDPGQETAEQQLNSLFDTKN
jgi:hypothetical protein